MISSSKSSLLLLEQILWVTTTLFCSVVFGYVLLFDIVIMPGLANLDDDAAYLLAFQAIDGVIQRGQPIFGLTWIGSLLTIVLLCARMSYRLYRVGRAKHPVGNYYQYGHHQGTAQTTASSFDKKNNDDSNDKKVPLLFQWRLVVAATILWIMGQVVTGAGNIPLNNQIHTLDITGLDDDSALEEREKFETPWNRYNLIRTILFGVASVLLLCLPMIGDPAAPTTNNDSCQHDPNLTVVVNGQTDGEKAVLPNYKSIS